MSFTLLDQVTTSRRLCCCEELRSKSHLGTPCLDAVASCVRWNRWLLELLNSQRPSAQRSLLRNLRLSLARPRWWLTTSEVCKCASICSLLVAVCTDELGLTLPMLPWHSMAAAHTPLPVISFDASSIPPLQRICSSHPKGLSKACAHSFFVTLASCRRAILHRGPLPPTCGFMTSARIAPPCFPRPRFELGLSSRVPQFSAKRVRPSCSTKSRFSRSCITV